MYVYDYNVILKTAKKNRSAKEIMHDFTELTTDLKICQINPGFNFVGNEASKALKMVMTTMDINYQLTPPPQVITGGGMDRDQSRHSRTTS